MIYRILGSRGDDGGYISLSPGWNKELDIQECYKRRAGQQEARDERGGLCEVY